MWGPHSHTAILHFHNAVIDHLRKDPTVADQSAERIFKLAQRQVCWHYQWIILYEFLPLTIGQERVDEILKKGLRYYDVDKRNPLIPIKFQCQPTGSAIRKFVQAIV